jgi:hypothetical protein
MVLTIGMPNSITSCELSISLRLQGLWNKILCDNSLLTPYTIFNVIQWTLHVYHMINSNIYVHIKQ